MMNPYQKQNQETGLNEPTLGQTKEGSASSETSAGGSCVCGRWLKHDWLAELEPSPPAPHRFADDPFSPEGADYQILSKMLGEGSRPRALFPNNV